MEIDFQDDTWSELFDHTQGNGRFGIEHGSLRVESGTVAKAGTGTVLTSTPIQYLPGQKITVSVRAKSRDLKYNEARWHSGRVLIYAYDEDMKWVAEREINRTRGTKDWYMEDRWVIFPAGVAYYRIIIHNKGKSGSLWYDDLKVEVSDQEREILIEDGAFNGALSMPNSFTHRTKDWNGRALPRSSRVALDTSRHIVGTRSLAMTGQSVLTSRTIPYDGEYMNISGWLRTENSQDPSGKHAVIQAVGFDGDGQYVEHVDAEAKSDDHQWRFVSRDFQFSPKVKRVEVWLRTIDTGSRAWFDGVQLFRLPHDSNIRPFNRENATVIVDLAHIGDTINHKVWAGVDVGLTSWLLYDGGPASLDWLKQAGFEYIRLHETSYGLRVYQSNDEQGNPIYNWERFDKIFDQLRDHGLTPILTLESTPRGLARKERPEGSLANWKDVMPPRDMEGWSRYVEAFMSHAIERYGNEYVSQWLWEIWNEPGTSQTGHYYWGTEQELQEIAVQVYLASIRVEDKYDIDIKMGLSSGGRTDVLLEGLKKANLLTHVDHFSRHIYAGAHASVYGFVPEVTLEFQNLIDQYPSIAPVLRGNTEWNSTAAPPPLGADGAWNATLAIVMSRLMLDEGFDYATYFCMTDHPSLHTDKTFNEAHWGMFTKNAIPKAVYNAFVFMNELKHGRRLKLTSSNLPIEGIAVVMDDGTIRLVLASYDENTALQPYDIQIRVELPGLDGQYHCTRHWVVDQIHGNSYLKWVDMGCPAIDDESARQTLVEESRYGLLQPVQLLNDSDGSTAHFEVSMSSPAVHFIELMPTSEDAP